MHCIDKDHPSDIIICGDGNTLAEAFEQNALAMYNYISPIQYIDEVEERDFEVEGK